MPYISRLIQANPAIVPAAGNIAPLTVLSDNWALGFAMTATDSYVGSVVNPTMWALNNAWNYPPNGTQWMLIDPTHFPSNTKMLWDYQSPGPGNVWGYPAVLIGNKEAHGSTQYLGYQPSDAWINQPISSFTRFKMTWNMTLDGQNGTDVLAEGFPYSGAAGGGDANSYNETGVHLWNYPYVAPFWNSKTRFSAAIAGATVNGVPTTVTYEFVPNYWATGSLGIMPKSPIDCNGVTPWLVGSIDWVPIWTYAISQGWRSASETIGGWAIGPEWRGGDVNTPGKGSMLLNYFAWDIA